MKIGILTFHYVANYGAVLQAYALKKYLESKGVVADIVDYRPSSKSMLWIAKHYIKYQYKCLLGNNGFSNLLHPFRSAWSLMKFTLELLKYPLIKRKYSRFDNFVKRFLINSNGSFNSHGVSAELSKYDMVFYGSDQIWNPEITDGFDSVYFPLSGNTNQKFVSYAASVGDVNLIKGNGLESVFLNMVLRFHKISVRENKLQLYLNSKGIQSTLVLDPTLLLDRKDYLPLIQHDYTSKTKFLLVYELVYDNNLRAIAKCLAKKLRLQLKIINGTFSGGFNSMKDIGPCDFLTLLNAAEFVITNSFHGLAFSIIFEKEFGIVLPAKRSERLVNLLENFDLVDRIIDNPDLNSYVMNNINYSRVHEILGEMKSRSYSFIQDSISDE